MKSKSKQMQKLILSLLVISSSVFSNAQTTRSAQDASGLAVGAEAPVFKAIDAGKTEFVLTNALKEGPVVLIFYRGFWCPYCSKHLALVQDSLKLLSDKGATVVAVSPEKPEYLDKMATETGASFRLLYDRGYSISDAYDVTFTPKKSKLIIYNTTLRANLKETHSDDSQQLPIPATYIINQKGKIVWRHFDPNYKKRSSVKEILENLP